MPTPPRRAFSLVELLVVIGILGLLIALLLPSLSLAREHANQVKCLATLRGIGQAAVLHVNEHHGFYPCAGWEWNPDGGVVDPQGMGDAARLRYDYYTDDGIDRPMPITAALASSLGVPVRTDSREALAADLQSESIRRLFRCPSQQVIDSGWSQHASDGWYAPEEFSSYAFNEALLGRRDRDPADRPYPCGQSAAVHAPSEVFFAMDGRLRDAVTDRCFLVFDYGPNDTVNDFNANIQRGTLGKELIDPWRHRQRINVLFVDGHAATFGIEPADLDQIGVSRGLN